MWQIDSRAITDYNASKEKLEALIMFWVLAAGKSAKGATRILMELVDWPDSPFFQIRDNFSRPEGLANKLKLLGCGCHSLKAKAIFTLAHSNINLKTCTIDELEVIPGIGRKTSRAFIVHSRKDAQHAIIDTHILKFLKEQKVKDVPKSTPASKREYERLEGEFLKICKEQKRQVAEFDLEIWKSYAV